MRRVVGERGGAGRGGRGVGADQRRGERQSPRWGGGETPRERGGKWGSRSRVGCKQVIVLGYIGRRATIALLCVVKVGREFGGKAVGVLLSREQVREGGELSGFSFAEWG